jgi:ABC-type branched-subunit amino acid transport system permease subunit
MLRLHPAGLAGAPSLIEVVELSLEALAADLAACHNELTADSDRRLPSAWLASVVTGHVGALQAALATYKAARLFEEDERLF